MRKGHKWLLTGIIILLGVSFIFYFSNTDVGTAMSGQHIGEIAMDWVAKPFLNVNVYSARQSSGDNILDCGMIDEPLGRVRQREAVIACTLLDY